MKMEFNSSHKTYKAIKNAIKTKNYKAFTILLAFISIFISNYAIANKSSNNDEKVNIQGVLYHALNKYEGSPYLFDKWVNGNLYLENGKTAYDIKLKFNILNGSLIFYHEVHRKLYTVDQNTVKSFTLKSNSSDSLYFEKYNNEDFGFKLKTNEFVQVLHQGEIKFYIKHTSTISVANELNSKDKIFPKKRYFIHTNEFICDVKPSIKSVTKVFGNKKRIYRQLASKNHLKNKSLADISKLLSLIEEQN